MQLMLHSELCHKHANLLFVSFCVIYIMKDSVETASGLLEKHPLTG